MRYRGFLSAAAVDFELELPSEGWRLSAVGLDRGEFVRLSNSTQAPVLDVALVLFMAEEPAEAIVNLIVTDPDVGDTTTPVETTVAGLPAWTVDVYLPPSDEPRAIPPCAGLLNLAYDRTHDFPSSPQDVYGCTWNRIWVVDVDGIAITVTGGAGFESLDPEVTWQIEDFQPLLDDFINAITFCTEATPCEG